MRGLLRFQQSDNQKSVSLAFSRRIIGLTRLNSTFYPAQSDQYLSSNKN